MSKIEWTEETLNPTVGCTKQSDGCKNCYAIIQANIRQANPNPKIAKKFEGTVKSETGADGRKKLNWTGRINFDQDTLLKPLFWKTPRLVFVNSLSDLFHDNVKTEWIDKFFAMAALAQRHTFQVLTKNPKRMAEYFRTPKRELIERWSDISYDFELTRTGKDDDEDIDAVPCDVFNIAEEKFPLPNVWLGVSVENQKAADERIPLLLETPAAVRFLSCEPLLSKIEFSDVTKRMDAVSQLGKKALNGIDWVIIGGESGHGARPCNIEWIRSIVDQCRSARVPVFVKQLGSVTHWNDGFWSKNKDKGADFSRFNAEFPANYRLREMPNI